LGVSLGKRESSHSLGRGWIRRARRPGGASDLRANPTAFSRQFDIAVDFEFEINAADPSDRPGRQWRAAEPLEDMHYSVFRSYGTTSPRVMAGLVPPSTYYSLRRRKKDVDARGKRGHDGEDVIRSQRDAR
jgi:hypothetical protein